MRPILRFSPKAWAKLLFLRDYGETEVGGFAISSQEDLLYIKDVQLVKQVCSWAHVAFDDNSVADFFDQQFDAGRKPEQFGRIWVHTHPGECPLPSGTDEQTFARVFGITQWSVMFILACEGQSYARLQFNVGPQASLTIPVRVDYSEPFGGCEPEKWEQEYLAHVQKPAPVRKATSPCKPDGFPVEQWQEWNAWEEELFGDEVNEENREGVIL